MYKIATAIVIIALFGASVYGDITFQGNVSFKGTAQDWQYRQTTMGHILNTGWFTSADVQHSGHSYKGDWMVGGIKAGLLSYPSFFLAYATATLNIGMNDNIFTGDLTAAASYIANCYLEVVEKDASGNIVKVLDLSIGGGLFAPIFWSVADSQLTGNPKYITLSGTSGSYNVKLTAIISDVAGVVSLGGAVVTPKVLETIVEIDNWPYKAPTNTLTLISVAATGAGTAHDTLIASGTGSNQVYYQLNDTVLVDGNRHSVIITSSAVVVDHLKDGDLVAQVDRKFNGNAQVQMYNITFPAGANKITYDPTLGSGATVQSQQSAAASTAVSFLLVVFFAVTLLM